MEIYKSLRIIDRKTKWVIVNENGNILNKNPNKQELNDLGIEKSSRIINSEIINSGEVCYRCGDKAKRREMDVNRKWTGKYICKKHYDKDYEHWLIYNDPNSLPAIRKSLAAHRIGNIDPNSSPGKGDMGEELTCILFGVENLNKENDDYNTPIDHSKHPILGILQTRVGWLEHIREFWNFSNLKRDWFKKYDNMICYCISKDGKIVERIYIFPEEEITGRKSITIVKNPSKGRLWYEKYRVIDEEMIEMANDIWNKIIKKIYKKEM